MLQVSCHYYPKKGILASKMVKTFKNNALFQENCFINGPSEDSVG